MSSERTAFDALVMSRRMTRDFSSRLVDANIIEHCIDLASRAPSAGKTQGWHVLLLTGDDTRAYWDATMPADVRTNFTFPRLLDAPVVMVVLADSRAYVDRYSEPDKQKTGWGEGESAWPTPFWTVDASFAAMTILLALEDAGLGALFFATAHQPEVRRAFGIPDDIQIIGTIAAGYRFDSADVRQGRSASRIRRDSSEIIRRGLWTSEQR